MSEKDQVHYRKIKADPVKHEAYLERKRNEARRRQEVSSYETERKRKWRAANAERSKLLKMANHAVEHAITAGKLKRPKECSKCGKAGKIEAHHRSYARSQWLIVDWLCHRCHAREHKP